MTVAHLLCSSLKDSLLTYLAEQTSAHDINGDCALTVPINTIDNRWVDIMVENRGPDFYLVHDSGKAVDELFLQGVAQSDQRSDLLKSIARRYGVSVEDGRFITGCPTGKLQHSIWAVAHCSGMAMGEILRHKPNIETEIVKTAVGDIVAEYGAERHIRVQPNVSAKGNTSNHSFDFIVDGATEVVAINVLNPGANAKARAERYGFQGFDLQQTHSSYQRLAVLANPSDWSSEARRLVDRFATRTVEFTNRKVTAPVLMKSLDSLLGRAA